MKDYKILIVDDLEVNLSILNKALTKYGLDTEIANSGKKALSKIHSFKPDVVLLDINMPEMDGFTCCKKIKESNPEIFVIFVTALSDKNIRDTAYAVGGTDILTKPIDIKLLINKVKGALKIKSELDCKGEVIKKHEEKSAQYKKTFVKFSNLKDLGSPAPTIAHDINNYLGGILGNVNLIEMTSHNTEVLSYCKNIQKAIESTADLTKQLSEYSQREKECKTGVDLLAILDNVLKLVERDVKYYVTIEKDFNSGQYHLNGVSSQLSNIFMNLLKNACEAVSGKGRIKVSMDSKTCRAKETAMGQLDEGLYAIIVITDNGCGIPADKLEKIYEPFHTTKEKGTGLGLDSVLTCLTAHNGAMEINSIVGEGTELTLYIPLSKAKTIVKLSTAERKPLIDLAKFNFIVVDDDEIFCDSLSKFIKMNGGNVKSFKDERFNKFCEDPRNLKDVDYLLIDYKIPFIDTLQVIEDLSASNPNLKSIIISGSFVDISDLENAFFLRKPLSLNRILDVLQVTLK